MALTFSETLAPGMPIPDFSLPDVVTSAPVTPASLAGPKALVIIFLCRHCPYVGHVLPEVVRLAGHYLPREVAFAGISANDAVTYPDDSPANLAKMAAEQRLPFPVLHDDSQKVARAFHAVCTPEFFVLDRAHHLYYHGRFDGSTPGNGVACDGSDLRHALDALLAGAAVPDLQQPSMGCNIKWK